VGGKVIMTEGQLALLRHVIEKVKICKPVAISNDEIVDLDSMYDYFNNLLLDIENNKKRMKVGRGTTIVYRLLVEINK
jgi:hypothetical protein